MAYITNAVYYKLIKSRINNYVDVPQDLFDELEYHFGVSQVLSSYELGILGEHIRMCSNFYDNSNQKPFLYPKEDQLLYVFEKEATYKYHVYEDCSYLNNDFYNYVVPIEVRLGGKKLVEDYRNWFIEKGFINIVGDDKDKISRITFSYNTTFAPLRKLPLLSEYYELIVSRKNSTYSHSRKYYSLLNIQNTIRNYRRIYKRRFDNKAILNLMNYSYYQYAPKSVIEQRVSELTSDVFINNYGYEMLMNDFKEANRIKSIIIEELKLFINFRCGFQSNDFSKKVLESYGLVCCKACLEKYNNDNK